MAIIKKARITNAGKDVEKREPLCAVSGDVNSTISIVVIPLWKTV